MRRSGTPGLAFSLALLLASLAGCGGGLYTAEGLPPLDAGPNVCIPNPNTQLDCGGPPPCTDRNIDHCEACGVPCAARQNATVDCLSPNEATTPRSCTYTCNPGWLNAGAGCERAVAVAAGGNHTCAVTLNGTLRCWGANDAGQVTRTSTSVAEPLPVTVFGSGAGFVLAAGQSHTCAVVSGQVQCWGANGSGQAAPPALTGTVTGLAAGAAHTCAIAGGTVTCWGDASQGKTTPHPDVAGLIAASATTRIVAGANHTCTLHVGGTALGAVRCWGDAGKTAGGAPFSSGIVAIAAGQGHTCAADGSPDGLFCWGANPGGTVLPGLPDPQPVPAIPPKEGGSQQNIVGSKPVVYLAAGRAHTCAVLVSVPAEPSVCFGESNALQLGNVDPGPQTSATIVGLTVEPRIFASGAEHTCAITAQDELKCWGRNDLGQLGTGATQAVGTGTPGAVFVSGR